MLKTEPCSFKVLDQSLLHKICQLIGQTNTVNFVSGNELTDGFSYLNENGGHQRVQYPEFLLEFVAVQKSGGDNKII
jgi:hypothetical protein